MEELKIFGVNIGAVIFSTIPEINTLLQTLVLLLSLGYTILMIMKKLKE